jgi:tRNA (guanine37-N1)-methyltransferase
MAPKLAWETPFKPFVPRPTAKEERAARKERERLQAETKARAQSEAQGQADDSQAASATATTPNPVSVKVSATALPKLPGHYIMNLPDSALTFLSSFRSSFTPLKSVDSFNTAYPDLGEVPMPLIHVYCFTREMEFAGAQIDILKVSTLPGSGDGRRARKRVRIGIS